MLVKMFTIEHGYKITFVSNILYNNIIIIIINTLLQIIAHMHKQKHLKYKYTRYQ